MDINIKGLDKLQSWIDERINKVKNMEKLKSDIAVALDSSMIENFEKEQTPEGVKWGSYAKLSDSTLEYRAKKGLQTRMLYNYGSLWQTMDTEITGYGVKSGSINGSVPYARIHQMGGMAGRGRKVYIPARPYIGLNPKLESKIKKIIEEHT